jgi:hypothetical protein
VAVSAHKHREHLQKIKDAVHKSENLSTEEKKQTVSRIDEWIAEDKAEGIVYEELLHLASGIRPILRELGLL